MARRIRFDRSLIHSESGLIPLKRGDDWLLTGKITQKTGNVETDEDLTGAAASAFFEQASGGTYHREVVLNPPDCGKFAITVPKEDTPNLALAELGTTIYLTIQDSNGISTVDSESELEVKNREFQTF